MKKFASPGPRQRSASAGDQLSTANEQQSTNDAFEALLYLRRSSELLNGNCILETTKSRVDLAIREVQEALAFPGERAGHRSPTDPLQALR
jgi:hypothetical protein